MKLINVDKLRNDVLKWLPSNPYTSEYPLEEAFVTDICVSTIQTIDEQEPIDAIPCDYIRELIRDPAYAGIKSCVLSWLLKRWKNESEGNN